MSVNSILFIKFESDKHLYRVHICIDELFILLVWLFDHLMSGYSL